MPSFRLSRFPPPFIRSGARFPFFLTFFLHAEICFNVWSLARTEPTHDLTRTHPRSLRSCPSSLRHPPSTLRLWARFFFFPDPDVSDGTFRPSVLRCPLSSPTATFRAHSLFPLSRPFYGFPPSTIRGANGSREETSAPLVTLHSQPLWTSAK